MKKTIIVILFFFIYVTNLFSKISYKNFELDNIKFSKYNNAFVIYDFIFPTLIRFIIINDNDSAQDKILKVIKFINFYSTPGKFKRYKGLGTGAPWWRNSSIMLTSGYLLCSEQSSLATLILKTDFTKFALRDVTNHTFHEVLYNNKWIILDPMFDNRILNRYNEIVSFNDIQRFLSGKRNILKLPQKTSKRTLNYLNLFKKETYKPVRMAFGQNQVLPIDNTNLYVGISVNKFIKILKKYKYDINKKIVYPYLIFIRNNIIRMLRNIPQSKRKQVIYLIQDYFFDKISKQFMRGWIPLFVDKLYIARNYQFLERYNKSLKILNKYPLKDKQIAFYKSQIYFKIKNNKKFNNFIFLLKDNIFYRYMYWLLNKKYLLKTDEKDFDKFPYKLVDYDKIIVEKGKLEF